MRISDIAFELLLMNRLNKSNRLVLFLTFVCLVFPKYLSYGIFKKIQIPSKYVRQVFFFFFFFFFFFCTFGTSKSVSTLGR